MAIERTFSIIKPNAVAKNVIGNIFSRFEAAGFKIVGTKMLHLTVEQARGFYAEHDGKPFFDGLVEFMTSGPIGVSVRRIIWIFRFKRLPECIRSKTKHFSPV